MTNQTTGLERVRWLLAERLEGMRAFCDSPDGLGFQLHVMGCPAPVVGRAGCCGYAPVPLTAEGQIDERRLRQAIEESGFSLGYNDFRWWVIDRARQGFGSDLALAYLQAAGVEVIP